MLGKSFVKTENGLRSICCILEVLLPCRKVDVSFELDEGLHAIHIKSLAKTVGTTGVEMEALMATTVAALTIYDMCKAVSKDIMLQNIGLDYKIGGKSGEYSKSEGNE